MPRLIFDSEKYGDSGSENERQQNFLDAVHAAGEEHDYLIKRIEVVRYGDIGVVDHET